MLAFKPQETKIVIVNPQNPKEADIALVAEAARFGQVVVFPTDTVYGIGTNALLPEAVLGVFKAKGRPTDKPLILLVADPSDVDRYVIGVNDAARRLIKEYWPGPLTLIFKKSTLVPEEVTAGGNTVGIRCPDDIIARTLIKLVGVALATTSANITGKPSPKNAEEAKESMMGRVDYIIDGGQVKLGVESTVVDMSSEEPKLVREGHIPWDELKGKLRLS